MTNSDGGKMKNKKILLIAIFILTWAFIVTYTMPVLADSGFDSSFDSGSSSSSFDSSFGSDSSSGGDGFSIIVYFIELCFRYPLLGLSVLVISVIIYLSSKKNKEKTRKEIIAKALSSKLELLDVSKYPIEKQLEIEAFNIYKKIQYAWMNFDEEMLRSCTTDEMYNMYLMQLDTLKVKNQKNLMYDIKYLDSKIIKEEIVNGQKTITMNMNVSCYDFIIDTRTNTIVRGSEKINNYLYELTFVKTVEDKTPDICPRCGAKVEGNNSGVCEYCKSTLVSSNYTLIMSKKKMISQK